jgi:hypothetical protein
MAKKMSARCQLLLLIVGCVALALDKLEGKSIEPPRVKRTGRIRIVQ